MANLDTNDKIKEVTKTLSKMKPSYITTDGKELRVRCPYCGDSKKHSSSAHMYIKLEPPFMFHCFKCDASGCLNSETLKDFQIYNNDVQLNIIELNKTVKRKKGKSNNKKKNSLNLYVEYNERVQHNIDYFNQRFGFCYTYNDIEYLINMYKLVLDADQVFKNNKIYPSERELNYFDYFNAIGFLSSDCSHIVFRNIQSDIDKKKRYNNLKINSDPNAKKSYSLGTNIDILSNKITLVMTEGIFDIIGVYENFYKNSNTNFIFAAACGKSYAELINKYLRMGFLNMDIIIYSDKDVDMDFYKELKYNSPYLKNKYINVIYNDLDKDFGVPKDRIKLRKMVI